MLHGTVQANQTLIGFWTAVREEELTNPDAEYTYRWQYSLIPIGEDPYEVEPFHGVLKHVYSDRAPALIAKIMSAVSELQKTRNAT